jgi:hypothetical protein
VSDSFDDVLKDQNLTGVLPRNLHNRYVVWVTASERINSCGFADARRARKDGDAAPLVGVLHSGD